MDISLIRKDFPILSTERNGQGLVYFDNAATTHKPWAVIDAISNFYAYEYSSVSRGLYYLAEKSTENYQKSRYSVASFINAEYHEVIFTSGATEGINFIYYS